MPYKMLEGNGRCLLELKPSCLITSKDVVSLVEEINKDEELQ